MFKYYNIEAIKNADYISFSYDHGANELRASDRNRGTILLVWSCSCNCLFMWENEGYSFESEITELESEISRIKNEHEKEQNHESEAGIDEEDCEEIPENETGNEYLDNYKWYFSQD